MVATGAQQRPKSEFALETVSVRGMEAWREQLYKEEAAQERYARRACSAPVRRELTRPVVYDPPTTLTAMLKTLHSKTSCSHAADRLLSQRIAQGRPRVPLPVDVYAPPVHPNATWRGGCGRTVWARGWQARRAPGDVVLLILLLLSHLAMRRGRVADLGQA